MFRQKGGVLGVARDDDGGDARRQTLETWASTIGKPVGENYSPYSRCKECLTTVEWKMSTGGKWIPLQPRDLPSRRVPARVAWHEDDEGLVGPGRKAGRCRVIHYAVCPARVGTLQPELDEVRRMLGVRGRSYRIAVGEDAPLHLAPNEYGVSPEAEHEGALFTENEVDDRGSMPVEVSRWDDWLQVQAADPAELANPIYVVLNRLGERAEGTWLIPRTPTNEVHLRRLATRNEWRWTDLPGTGPDGPASTPPMPRPRTGDS
ncbi:DUF6083 domain-containing protein [Kitasatospora sp. NPDC058046]|uniref:DUF6083 domain-containing protein n=1 Tax=Kitasatospora sp. NPDC058046 TaxID=3346312 RepID=UPI0036D9669B